MKLISIGLDGAAFELIGPWIEKGDLPNLKKIKEKGVWGNMESCLPPVSAPNWKCYSTGKNPGKLGIFWWENVDFKKQKIYCPDYRSDSKEIWDYLNEAGKKVAVINMPLTYPPRKVSGYLSSGGPSAKEENFTYPKSWKNELKQKGYRVHPSKSVSSRETCREVYDEIIEMIKSRFELAREFAKDDEVEFIHLSVFYINVLQHFFWKDKPLKKAWRVIDEKIGDLMSLTEGGEWNLVIFSDHGSNKIEEVFNINAWLKKEGLLKTERPALSSLLHKLRLTQEKAIGISEKIGLKNLLRKITPESTVNRVPTKNGGLSREAKTEMINWEESAAIGLGQGALYLKLGGRKTKEELIQKLEKVENPETGKRPARKILTREDIYSGKYLDKAPDLIIDQAPNTHISGKLGKDNIFEKPRKWKGENKKTGLFLAFGKEIKEGKNLEKVKILDIAPTILHLFDQPVPKAMDGDVMKEIFRRDCNPAKRKVKFSETTGKDRIKEKIKNLKKTSKI